MQDPQDNQPTPSDDSSLEGTPTTVVQPTAAPGGPAAPSQSPAPSPVKLPRRRRRPNIYLLLFILVLLLAAGVSAVTYLHSRDKPAAQINSQAISSDTLKQLASADATVGDPKQILSVQSNAVFAGKVLVRNDLDVAGTIHVNGSLSLAGITVGGQSNFDQVQVNKSLTVGGDTSLQGVVSIKKNLSVSGGGTFGGPLSTPQLSTNQLQVVGDLALTSHIVGGGPTPSRTAGSSLGSGGTAGVSGSDTAGSLNLNVGSGAAAGCFITVNFSAKYNNPPHVMLTPASPAAAGLSYYVSRTTTSFSVCSTVSPAAGSSIVFDYLVVG